VNLINQFMGMITMEKMNMKKRDRILLLEIQDID